MRKTLIALSLASAAAYPAVASAQAAPAATSPHSFTGNMSLVSEYRFRGIAQTFAKPALQGGFDYAHASGIYLGNWDSNVSSGAGFPAGNLEMDFYGGWKKSWGDFGLDIGYIYYYYPGSDANTTSGTAITNPRAGGGTHTGTVDNKEVYIGCSWKWFSAKYSYSVGDYFSQPGTKGSNYLDLGANFDLGGGWGLNGHMGSFRLKGWSIGTPGTDANYTDYKFGVTKNLGGWALSASYIDTNANGSCAAGAYYCFNNALPTGAGAKTKDAGKGVIVLSVGKSF